MKGEPPLVLIQWLIQNGGAPPPTWAALQNPEKRQLFVALLEEQGFVCVYCGAAITDEFQVAHIEHFRPQSILPELRFDWHNLFASCGPANSKGQPSICGGAKGDWMPINNVEPTDPDCERKFAYDGLGRITESGLGGEAATSMITRLNLHDASLDYQRAQIVAELEQQISAGVIDIANVGAEVESWRARDENNRLKPFGHVAARYLEDQALS